MALATTAPQSLHWCLMEGHSSFHHLFLLILSTGSSAEWDDLEEWEGCRWEEGPKQKGAIYKYTHG